MLHHQAETFRIVQHAASLRGQIGHQLWRNHQVTPVNRLLPLPCDALRAMKTNKINEVIG